MPYVQSLENPNLPPIMVAAGSPLLTSPEGQRKYRLTEPPNALGAAPPTGRTDINSILKGMGIDLTGINTSADLSSMLMPSTLSEEQKAKIKEQVGIETEAEIGQLGRAQAQAEAEARERGRARTGAMRAGLGIQAEGMGGVDTAAVGLIDATIKDMNKELENIQKKYAAEKMLMTSGERKIVDDRIAAKQAQLDKAMSDKLTLIERITGIQKTQKETELLGQEEAKPFFTGTNLISLMKEIPLGETREIPDPNTGDIYTITGTAEIENAEAELVNQMIRNYPDAGITLTDDLAIAQSKLAGSRIYQQKTRLAGRGVGAITPTTDVMPTNINEAIDISAQQLVEMRNKGRLNDLVYKQYVDGLMADWGISEEQRGEVESLLNQAMEGGIDVSDEDIGSDFDIPTESEFQTGAGVAGEAVRKGGSKVLKATGKYIKDFIPSLMVLTGETGSYLTNFVRGIVGYKNEITEEEKRKVYKALGIVK